MKNNSIGQIFTPEPIAKFMVKNSLQFITSSKKSNDLKILEPSVGKGIFLKYLIQNNLKNITAYEIDETLKAYLSNSYPEVKFVFKNVLGSDPNEKFDLIIGNPPYLGQNYNAGIFQEYIKEFPICERYFVGNMDLFYYFIHMGILKLNPGGILSFITTNYWITKSKKTGIKLLKPHILDECYLIQYIDLTNLRLFKDASGQHNCIFVLQKKNNQERAQTVDKKIKIIQIGKNKEPNLSNSSFNKSIFKNLSENKNSRYIQKYYSSLTNRDLEKDRSWNLLYPEKIRKIVDKIESYCSINKKIFYLKDYFIIRNGLILIKDDIFILQDGDMLKIEDNDFLIKINDRFHKLNKVEIKRLKKIHKSKSILPYGYEIGRHAGYIIYFNKNEFITENLEKRNQLLQKKYPNLTAYIRQFENELRNILINAKEKPLDFYFPRRGAFIRRIEKTYDEELIDLEPLYDQEKKIFLKYISKDNIFGFSEDAYYATSDTYFLWPKRSPHSLNYPFLLAYLNSSLVKFLFKAKSISIKRSKTKLEYGLPIPNIKTFQSKNDIAIISTINILSEYMIGVNHSNKKIKMDDIKKILINLDLFSNNRNKEFLLKIITAIQNCDILIILNLIDQLFFKLFKLDEKSINYLIEW